METGMEEIVVEAGVGREIISSYVFEYGNFYVGKLQTLKAGNCVTAHVKKTLIQVSARRLESLRVPTGTHDTEGGFWGGKEGKKIINTSPGIDTTRQDSLRPEITSFYEPGPDASIIGICVLPTRTSNEKRVKRDQVTALLRNTSTLEFVVFSLDAARRKKAKELDGKAREPDGVWRTVLNMKEGGGKWVGLDIVGQILYAWTNKGRVEFWGVPEKVEKEKEPEWTFRGTVQVPVQAQGVMEVAVVRVQPYPYEEGPGVPEKVTFAVGHTTDVGEMEVFEVSTGATALNKAATLDPVSIFKSKPSKPNALKLPIPGGVSCICWLPMPPSADTEITPHRPPAGGTCHARTKNLPAHPPRRLFLATGTPTGELRLYDTSQSRRPIFRGEVQPRGGAATLRRGIGTSVTRAGSGFGSGAIVSLTYVKPLGEPDKATNKLTFIFSDGNAKFGVYIVSIKSAGTPVLPGKSEWTGQATLKIAGDVTGIVRGVSARYHEAPPGALLLASVGLDRYLRIYKVTSPDVGKGRVEILTRVYAHTRGVGVVWVGEVDKRVWESERERKEREKEERRWEREKEVEEVWMGIEGVERGEEVEMGQAGVKEGSEDEDNESRDEEEDSEGDEESEHESEEDQSEGKISPEEESLSPSPPPNKKRTAAAAQPVGAKRAKI
ncbi:hypothetical protein BDZ91DRAFT_785208 [Kalaharituber pfeilii]|nr:hypothetical protein BDZ91DRAFT_785208 [Kalaharituber pfeilii]